MHRIICAALLSCVGTRRAELGSSASEQAVIMNQRLLVRIGQGLVAAVLCAPAYAASFMPLGDLPGGLIDSGANAVSADGSVVVGASHGTLGGQAFRWTSAGGMVGLGYLPGRSTFSGASGVSDDGAVVVGSSGAGDALAFRWTAATGLVSLGDLPGSSSFSAAEAVSVDGSVIAGVSQSSLGREVFRWTGPGGMVALGDLPGGIFWSFAEDVSADGTTIVGHGETSAGKEAFRWTGAEGMVGMGGLPGGDGTSAAHAVSADGSVIVGWAGSSAGQEPFRWTSAGGMAGLGHLPGAESSGSFATAVSADGSIVLGRSGGDAFYWTESEGMVRLLDWLVAHGATGLAGWTLVYANDVSADGRWIVGQGVNPAGNREAFIVSIVPVPAAAWLLGSALGLLPWMRRVATGTVDTTPRSRHGVTRLLR